MTTTPYIINDEKRLGAAGFGKGCIAVITDDCMATLTPVRYNGCKDPTICLRVSEEVNLDDVRNKMPKREIDAMLRASEEELSSYGPLTGKGVTRPEWKSWMVAAKFLRLLADQCEDRSCSLELAMKTETEKKPA